MDGGPSRSPSPAPSEDASAIGRPAPRQPPRRRARSMPPPAASASCTPVVTAIQAADLAAVDPGAGNTATAVGEERDSRVAALGEVRFIYAGANPSHVLALDRGLTWCQKCGAYSFMQAARGLARPCAGAPTPFGRTVLARLGRTPPRPPPHTSRAD